MQTISATDLDEMLVIGGRTYVTTVGAQSKSGPYTAWGSQGGGAGGGTTFGPLTYDFPNDGREYIALKFRNPDGSAFMKVSKYPEDSEAPE